VVHLGAVVPRPALTVGMTLDKRYPHATLAKSTNG
jgi:hypothetical protein